MAALLQRQPPAGDSSECQKQRRARILSPSPRHILGQPQSPVPSCQVLAHQAAAPGASAAEIAAGAVPLECGRTAFFCNDLIFSGQ